MSKEINLNINQEEPGLNDYLYCWSQFGIRPNKISLYNHYEPDLFFKVISNEETCGTITDIIPTGLDYLVNEKSLVKISDELYVSFSQFDKLTDSKMISDVSIYFKNESSKQVEDIIAALDEIVVDYLDQDSQERFNTVFIGQAGLEIESINLLETDYDNIDLYYEDDVFKSAKKIIKQIKKSNKGLSILLGERGVGKTHLINHIISNVDKIVIFIPSTMIEHTINNPDFLQLIKRYQNSIIVIDDCETYFTDIYRKSTFFVNNLLQLVDGYQSDLFSVNFILSLNITKEDLYDTTLLDCNNLLGVIEISELSAGKVKELCQHLKYKNKVKSPMKLVDVLKQRPDSFEKVDFGFN